MSVVSSHPVFSLNGSISSLGGGDVPSRHEDERREDDGLEVPLVATSLEPQGLDGGKRLIPTSESDLRHQCLSVSERSRWRSPRS